MMNDACKNINDDVPIWFLTMILQKENVALMIFVFHGGFIMYEDKYKNHNDMFHVM